jgi:hypothetical protein
MFNTTESEMSDTIITTAECQYKKDTGTLVKPHNERFPTEVFVVSNVTGRTVRFIPIPMSHPMYDEDGWDGEQAVYQPCANEAYTNAKVLVLHHF